MDEVDTNESKALPRGKLKRWGVQKSLNTSQIRSDVLVLE